MSANSKLFVRWAVVLVLVAVLLGGLAGRAQAVEIDRNGKISAGTTVDDDLVMAANDVVMDGTINGTLIAAGNTVTITGTVKSDVIAVGRSVVIDQQAVIEGNLFVGASTVVVRGKITGTVFGGASAFTLGASAGVGRNLFYGGFDLTMQSGSTLGRDLYAGAYQTTLDGTLRNANIAAAAIEINGSISGDAVLRVADSSMAADINSYRNWGSYWPDMPAPIQPGLRISEGAKIGGKLTYTSQADQGSSIQAVPGGGIVYQTPVPNRTETQRANTPRINFPSVYLGWVRGVGHAAQHGNDYDPGRTGIVARTGDFRPGADPAGAAHPGLAGSWLTDFDYCVVCHPDGGYRPGAAWAAVCGNHPG